MLSYEAGGTKSKALAMPGEFREQLGGQYGSLTVHRRISAQSRAAEGRGQSRGMVGRKKSALEVGREEKKCFGGDCV